MYDMHKNVRRHSHACAKAIAITYFLQYDYHNTALMKACEKGYADTVRVLLDHGASVNQQNKVRNNIPIVP